MAEVVNTALRAMIHICGEAISIHRARRRSQLVVNGTIPRDWRENMLIRAAVSLAIMEQGAIMLSVLSFVWATAVILGGFASDLKPLDFCYVSIILVLEGARILSRRHELRWQRHRSSDNSDGFPLISYRYNSDNSDNGFMLWCLQVIPNLACLLLSLLRLIKHDYHRSDNGGTGNLKLALDGFYSLVLAESVTMLWQRGNLDAVVVPMFRRMSSSTISERSTISEHSTISVRSERDGDSNGEATILTPCSLREKVIRLTKKYRDPQLWSLPNRDSTDRTVWSGEDRDGGHMFDLQAFFYNSFLKCMEGEILDGMRTDLTCYAVELLLSRSLNEQLRGARILCNFLTDREDKTGQKRRQYSLSKLENSSETLVNLIEMLRWEEKNSVDIPENDDISELRRILVRTLKIKKDLRRFATNILLEFVTEDPQNAHRLASFPGCLDSILSLLFERGDGSIPAGDRLNLKGLKLLEAITQKDDTGDTCDKIGNTPALLSKIIEFTAVEETIGLSLQVLWNLVRTEGPTGIRVRCNILEDIFIAGNLLSILRTQNDDFLNYAIDILMYLAMDNKKARGKIGRAVGGITDGLLTLFLNKGNNRAGKTLYMLSLEHQDNCDRIAVCTRELMEKLLNTLRHPNPNDANNEHEIIICSANILRNIFGYGSPNVSELKDIACSVLQAVGNGIKMTKDELLLESYLGLAVEIYKVINETSSLCDEQKLIELLKKYVKPSINVPCIRRYSIELANLMMEIDRERIATFKSKGLGEVLKSIRETTSELESFYMFSGRIGLNSFEKTMHDLCRTATRHLSQDIPQPNP